MVTHVHQNVPSVSHLLWKTMWSFGVSKMSTIIFLHKPQNVGLEDSAVLSVSAVGQGWQVRLMNDGGLLCG